MTTLSRGVTLIPDLGAEKLVRVPDPGCPHIVLTVDDLAAAGSMGWLRLMVSGSKTLSSVVGHFIDIKTHNDGHDVITFTCRTPATKEHPGGQWMWGTVARSGYTSFHPLR